MALERARFWIATANSSRRRLALLSRSGPLLHVNRDLRPVGHTEPVLGQENGDRRIAGRAKRLLAKLNLKPATTDLSAPF